MTACADCTTEPPVEGSVRLRGGFGSPCGPVHSGFVEVFHLDEWGAICSGQMLDNPQVADVVCRQIGFPHGVLVDPSVNPPDPPLGVPDYGDTGDQLDEAEELQQRFWLQSVSCRGPEKRLIDCLLGRGFQSGNAGCTTNPSRLTVACRSFAISEALENVTTPGARATPLPS